MVQKADLAANQLHLLRSTIKTELSVIKSVPSSGNVDEGRAQKPSRRQAVREERDGRYHQMALVDMTCSCRSGYGLLCSRLSPDEGCLKSYQEKQQSCLLAEISPEELF